MPNRKRESWKGWAVVDRSDTYRPVVFTLRSNAVDERDALNGIELDDGAQFSIVRVTITVDKADRKKAKR